MLTKNEQKLIETLREKNLLEAVAKICYDSNVIKVDEKTLQYLLQFYSTLEWLKETDTPYGEMELTFNLDEETTMTQVIKDWDDMLPQNVTFVLEEQESDA